MCALRIFLVNLSYTSHSLDPAPLGSHVVIGKKSLKVESSAKFNG